MTETRSAGPASDHTERQLALNLRLREGLSFENFLPGRNRETLERLRTYLTGGARCGSFFVWGERGSGRSHLLTAACREVEASGRPVAYVSLTDHAELEPEMLENLEHCALVCLDDVDCIVGRDAWEAALFALYERLRARAGLWLAAANAAPAALGLSMSELATRLTAGWVHGLNMLGDEEKCAALMQRARSRGMELPEEVARYVLTHFSRDPHTLFELLDRIDTTALAAQRRLTIPFIRTLL